MVRRAGSADLPLHGGQVPAWLADRMTRLGAVISEAIVHHYGRDELLRRLAHPFWFQSFGAVMGMDWHSSGITTSVIGALKRGLAPLRDELGIHVCGGRGKHSRQTPHELVAIGERVGFDGAALAASEPAGGEGGQRRGAGRFPALPARFHRHRRGPLDRRSAGNERGALEQARRYHWLSEGLRVSSTSRTPPSTGRGRARSSISPTIGRKRRAARSSSFLPPSGPMELRASWRRFAARDAKPAPPAQAAQMRLPHLHMPAHHDVRSSDVMVRRLHGNLAAAADRGPADFPSCCSRPASARAPCSRSPWSRRSCTARPTASPTRRGFRSRMEARTGTRSRCRFASTTRPFGS